MFSSFEYLPSVLQAKIITNDNNKKIAQEYSIQNLQNVFLRFMTSYFDRGIRGIAKSSSAIL